MSAAIRVVKSAFSSKTQICPCRFLTTTAVCNGKRNFRKFLIHNKRGSRQFKQEQYENPDPELRDRMGIRPVGYFVGRKFVFVPEMVPELVVPDLEGFKLKPYVSYRAPDVVQSEFTAKDLFDAIYSRKITEDFHAGKLDENGNPLEPSEMEKLSADEARKNARKTGSDIF